MKCLYCNKKINNNKNIYCSKNCFLKDNNIIINKKDITKIFIKKICPTCNKKFKTYKHHKIYCSYKCRIITNHKNAKPQIVNRKTKNNYQNNKRKINPLFKLRQNTSVLIYQHIKKNGYIKPIFPFTKKELFNHLKKEFPKGYNWEDYLKNNKIHLEHKIPLSWFKTEQDLINIGWHLQNLTFLTKEENIKKSNKYAIVNGIKYYDKTKAINKFKELYLINLLT